MTSEDCAALTSDRIVRLSEMMLVDGVVGIKLIPLLSRFVVSGGRELLVKL